MVMRTGHAGVYPRSSQAHQPQVSCQSDDVVEPSRHIRPVVALSVATPGPRQTSRLEL